MGIWVIDVGIVDVIAPILSLPCGLTLYGVLDAIYGMCGDLGPNCERFSEKVNAIGH
jgi:hypothetical protein